MPSRPHEDLLRLFQNRPSLAAEVARPVLHAEPPPESAHAHMRRESGASNLKAREAPAKATSSRTTCRRCTQEP